MGCSGPTDTKEARADPYTRRLAPKGSALGVVATGLAGGLAGLVLERSLRARGGPGLPAKARGPDRALQTNVVKHPKISAAAVAQQVRALGAGQRARFAAGGDLVIVLATLTPATERDLVDAYDIVVLRDAKLVAVDEVDFGGLLSSVGIALRFRDLDPVEVKTNIIDTITLVCAETTTRCPYDRHRAFARERVVQGAIAKAVRPAPVPTASIGIRLPDRRVLPSEGPPV